MKHQRVASPSAFVALSAAALEFWNVLYPEEEMGGPSGLALRIQERMLRHGYGAGKLAEPKLLAVSIEGRRAQVAVKNGPIFVVELFPFLVRGFDIPDWRESPSNAPLTAFLEKRPPKSVAEEQLKLLFEIAVETVCEQVNFALRKALADKRLEATGFDSGEPLGERKTLPASLFDRSGVALSIRRNEILPGASKITDVQVRCLVASSWSDDRVLESFEMDCAKNPPAGKVVAINNVLSANSGRKRQELRDLWDSRFGSSVRGRKPR